MGNWKIENIFSTLRHKNNFALIESDGVFKVG